MPLTDGGIRVLQGLEPVRLRVAMYIGQATCARLVEQTLRNLVEALPHADPSWKPPSAARLVAWRDRTFTIALDGVTLPIDPVTWGDPPIRFPYPRFYDLFMQLFAGGGTGFQRAGAVLNALSKTLEVAIVLDGHRYTTLFSRGGIVQLLHHAPHPESLGDVSLTFEPDATVVPGELSLSTAAAIVASIDGPVTLVDRTNEYATW